MTLEAYSIALTIEKMQIKSAPRLGNKYWLLALLAEAGESAPFTSSGGRVLEDAWQYQNYKHTSSLNTTY